MEGCAMGQVLHGSATTTEAIRRAIQHSQASLRQLAKRYGINPKTVAKWKARSSTTDQRTGPREPRSAVLSADEEAVVVAFRRHTLLPLDDCLYALQVQALPDWLLPYRHRRGQNRTGQALSPGRHRPHIQVRLRPTASKGNPAHRRRLPPGACSCSALHDPHRADAAKELGALNR